MTFSRLVDAATVVIVCLLGGVVLYGIGTPIIAIAVLAAAATAFTWWARGRCARTRGNQHKV